MIELIVITATLRVRAPVSERQYAMSDEHREEAPARGPSSGGPLAGTTRIWAARSVRYLAVGENF
jgi:hypothetical protein